MNGESPISAPVVGISQRRLGRNRQKTKQSQHRNQADQCVLQTARFVGRKSAAFFGRLLALVLAQPRLDNSLRDQCHEDRQKQDRRDGKPQVGRQTDRDRGIDQMNRVVRELRKNGVERFDQHVHGKGAGNRGKTGGQPGQRMTPNAEEGRACQRNQDQVTGIRGDARQDADEHQDVAERPPRRDGHQLSNQRVDQARLLGHADAQHGDDDQPHGREAHEARYE